MEIITRTDAKDLGLKRYFTGSPCRRGHIAQRFIGSGRCVECNIVLCSTWKSNNREIKSALDKRYREENLAAIKSYQREWYMQNRDMVIGRVAKNVAENPAAARKYKRDWKARNPDAVVFSSGLRRARQRKAMPDWFGELDEFVWREAAELACIRRDATGIEWHLDHMIPISSKKACGLHVGRNCQVIPAYLNSWKHNKMLLTEPDEWLKHL